jgi:hypothetical protein
VLLALVFVCWLLLALALVLLLLDLAPPKSGIAEELVVVSSFPDVIPESVCVEEGEDSTASPALS